MGFIIGIFFASCWMFIIALAFGFQNVEGILTFIGIFWVVFIVGCIAKNFVDSSKDEQNKLNDLQLESFENGEEKALEIINKLQWTPTGSMQSREKRYIALRCSPNNIEDFDWLVKYISHSGCHAEILEPDWTYDKYANNQMTTNPYATMAKTIGDSLFKCQKVNSDYTTTDILRIPKNELENHKITESRYSKIQDINSSSNNITLNCNNSESGTDNHQEKDLQDDMDNLLPMVKLHLTKRKHLVEERFKKDPVAQYNLQLLEEKKAELKGKKEEYQKMRNWDKDDVMISLSASSTLDIEEYKETIEDLKDEIEELKYEIEELKDELDEIKEEIEEEIEDEEWEREMDRY